MFYASVLCIQNFHNFLSATLNAQYWASDLLAT